MKLRRAALGTTLAVGLVMAAPPAQARDACKSLICLAGMSGDGTIAGGCSGAVSDFFSIQVWTVTGYKPGHTAAKRQQYLNGCSGAAMNQGLVQKIILLYGTLLFPL